MKPTPHRHVREVGHEQLYAPRHDDPYLDAEKPPQDARCPECGVIFHKGRWTWGPRPKDAISTTCPACLRIHDRFRGYVTLKGPFVEAHRDELKKLVEAREAHEKAQEWLRLVSTGAPRAPLDTRARRELEQDWRKALEHQSARDRDVVAERLARAALRPERLEAGDPLLGERGAELLAILSACRSDTSSSLSAKAYMELPPSEDEFLMVERLVENLARGTGQERLTENSKQESLFPRRL